MEKTKVVIYGLGAIGIEAAKLALTKSNLEIVGVYDIDQEKIGKDLGELIGGTKIGVKVKNGVFELPFDNIKADIALHMTQSSCDAVYYQLMDLMGKGYNIVSSCEELAYPWLNSPLLASALEKKAKEKNVTLLGTGVNPGFVMDRLALVMTGMCKDIESIYVERVLDAGKRRLPLQKKIGAGMSVEEFNKIKEKIGHKGLQESVAIIVAGLGWKLDKIDGRLNCLTAAEDMKTQFLEIKKGEVTGIDQYAFGIVEGKELVQLHLQMYVGAANPHDYLKISGEPLIELEIKNGLHGDKATIASLINSIPTAVTAKPGLLTVDQLAYPVFFK